MPPGSSPADEKRKSIARQLVPWRVIYLYRPKCCPAEDKFLLVLQVTRYKVVYFFINTDPAPLPALADAQIPISRTTHRFLDWDSYLDCARMYYEDYSEVERQLLREPRRVRGFIAAALRTQIIETVETSRHLSPHQIKLILDGLRGAQGQE